MAERALLGGRGLSASRTRRTSARGGCPPPRRSRPSPAPCTSPRWRRLLPRARAISAPSPPSSARSSASPRSRSCAGRRGRRGPPTSSTSRGSRATGTRRRLAARAPAPVAPASPPSAMPSAGLPRPELPSSAIDPSASARRRLLAGVPNGTPDASEPRRGLAYDFDPEVVPQLDRTTAALRPERHQARLSRSCGSACTAVRSSGSTTRRRRRSRRRSSTASRTSTSTRTPTCTAPRTPSRPARPTPTRARATRSRRFLNAAVRQADRLRARRDRGDQPRRAELGRRNVDRGRRDRHHLARAPRQHRPLAAARRTEKARGCAWRRSIDRGEVILEEYEKLLGPRTRIVVLHAGLERPRHDRPRRARWSRWRTATARASCVDGAQAVSHMPVDVQALDCDFYCLLGPQGLRPDRHRRSLRQGRRPRGDAAVAGRRQHDRRTSPSRRRPTRLPPCALRGRAPGASPTRSGSARRSTTSRARLENIQPLRARAPRLRGGAALQVPGLTIDRYRSPRRRGSCRSSSTESGPRTSGEPSIRRASPSAPATTAPSPFSAASGWRARFAPRSRRTTPARTSTRSWLR